MMDMFYKNIKWIICIICVVLFLTLAEDVFSNDIMHGDIVGYNLVSSYLIRNSTIPFAKAITWCGSGLCFTLLTLLSLAIFKSKKISLMILSNLIIVTILNNLLKFIFQRPRPTELRMIHVTGYSFPSGHSMISMAFYGLLIYLIYNTVTNQYLKWGLIGFLSLLILSIGISRIYLGVHYTSDVLAGFLIAISYLILFISIATKYINLSFK